MISFGKKGWFFFKWCGRRVWFPLHLCSKWCRVFEISGAQMFLLFPCFYPDPDSFSDISSLLMDAGKNDVQR